MKNLKIILLLTFVSTAIFSCVKPEDVVNNDPATSFVVPSGFNWKTTQTLNVSVVLPNNGEIQPLVITNTSGSVSYFQGYPDDESRTVNTIITIPSYENELKLSYGGAAGATIELVGNTSLAYNFNSANRGSSTPSINLGVLSNFTLYTGAGAVSNTGVSTVTGDIGANVGAISGFGLPSIFNGSSISSNSVTAQASIDLNKVVTQVGNTVVTNASHAPTFGSETLVPGVYSIGSAASINGPLTLDGQGDNNARFIFKIGGALTTGAGANVILINGASPQNIFWVATGAIAMGANTTISGNLISNPGAVSLGAGGKLDGRMLAVVGAVSINNSTTFIPLPSFSGTLAFEDLWPSTGDYDFNDLVVDYDFKIAKSNQEFVKSITATFTIKAFGAASHNGFGFTLPTLGSGDIVSASGFNVANSSVFNIGSNGLENGQSKPTIIVFDDTYRVMPTSTGGTGANTQTAFGYNKPVTIVVTINLANNAVKFSELNIGSFNPFMIVGTTVNGQPGSRSKEVHLANYKPTDLFDTTYFGKSTDDSAPSIGRYFVTKNNLPFAINIAEKFDWVVEFQNITGAHLEFKNWATSSGTILKDWYKNKPGYRNNNFIYPTPLGN